MRAIVNRNQKPKIKASVSLVPMAKQKVTGLRYTKVVPKKNSTNIKDLEEALMLIKEHYYSDDIMLDRIREKTLRDMVRQRALRTFGTHLAKYSKKVI